jgi:hypothetical protein
VLYPIFVTQDEVKGIFDEMIRHLVDRQNTKDEKKGGN